jgi:hypothetical protein
MSMRLPLFAALLALVPAAAGGAVSGAHGDALIPEFLYWTGDSAQRPDAFDQQLLRWNKSGAGFEALVSRTTEHYRMDPALARELVELALRTGNARTPHAEQQRIRARRLELLDAHPDAWLPLSEVARDADYEQLCDAGRLEGLVARWPDADAARVRLARVVPCLETLTVRTTHGPGGAEPFVTLAEAASRLDGATAREQLLRAAVLLVARRHADAEAGFDSARLAALRALQVVDDLEFVRLEQVVAEVAHDDAAFVESLDADARLDVAAALAQAGHLEAAHRWRARSQARRGPLPPLPECPARPAGQDRPTSCEDKRKDEQQRREHLRQKLELLAWSLGEGRGDAFGVLTQSTDDFMGPLSEGPWPALRDRVAAREGYAALVSGDPGWGFYLDAQDLEGAREDCNGCAEEILREMDQLMAQVAARPPPVVPPTPDGRPGALLARMDALIDAEPAHWVERPLPADAVTPAQAAAPCDDCEPPPDPDWAARLPEGRLVRWERDGERIVAITASQSLDPVGEVSAGGYWISLSDDGGAHFGTPLYTGLRVQQPYVVRPASKLSMLAGDTVRLEVSVREVDAARVTFPPVGDLPLKREADDRYVEIELAQLGRDRDDDGLADPVEVAMLLDPEDADTDDDGIIDGADMLPQVAWRAGGRDERAAALGAVLDVVSAGSFGAVITTDPHATTAPSDPLAVDGGTDAHNALGVTYLQAPVADLAPLLLRRPVIALSAAQVERLEKKRGAFYPVTIGGFAINRDGTEGVASWSARWAGGSLRLHLRDGRWIAEKGMQWVTRIDTVHPDRLALR